MSPIEHISNDVMKRSLVRRHRKINRKCEPHLAGRMGYRKATSWCHDCRTGVMYHIKFKKILNVTKENLPKVMIVHVLKVHGE